MNTFHRIFEKKICDHLIFRLRTEDSKMSRVEMSGDIECNFVLVAEIEGATYFIDNVYITYDKDGIYKEVRYDTLTTSKRWNKPDEFDNEVSIVTKCVECSHLSLSTLVSRIKTFVRQSAVKNEPLVQEYIQYFKIDERFVFRAEITNVDSDHDNYQIFVRLGNKLLNRTYTVKYFKNEDSSRFGQVSDSIWWHEGTRPLTKSEMNDILSSVNRDIETLNTHTVIFLYKNIEQVCKE